MNNRQLEVLDFIKRFIVDNGYSPTVREIMAGLNFKSPSSIQDYLRALVRNGIITYDRGKSRTIELLVQNEYLKESESTVNIPVLENTQNGVTKEFLEIPRFMLADYDTKNLYVYRQGKSIYIINANLALKDRPALIISDGEFSVEEIPMHTIFGTIIGEFKIY